MDAGAPAGWRRSSRMAGWAPREKESNRKKKPPHRGSPTGRHRRLDHTAAPPAALTGKRRGDGETVGWGRGGVVWPSEDPNEGGGGGGRGPARTLVIRPAAADRQAAKVAGGGARDWQGASPARRGCCFHKRAHGRQEKGRAATEPPPPAPSTGPAVLDRLE